ncbi:MAG TPA: bifunctional DNA-formamidopyrimidine glycosylase/DNA-(apurinic or apyrimidinic site) lyase [Acetobacteraceae bacterium]|jgi:formamidopyrimidine-DNA glycosylase
MPELPEVETVMRGLQSRLEGRRIVSAVTHREDLRWKLPIGLARRLTGALVTGFRRRGKYILMRLEGGTSVLLHLGMSGRIVLTPVRPNLPILHEHLVLETDDGWRLGFVDPRRFGSVDLVPTALEEKHRLLAELGPEPLEAAFTPASLAASLAGKRTPIKAALLDQKIVAGLGNIYVCEALFRARLSPLRSAHTVPGTRAVRLVPAIQDTLREAIAAGGSSLRDYVQPDGELGYFQHAWKVYGREGEPCERCPGKPVCPGVRRVTQSARSSFYCPRSQR